MFPRLHRFSSRQDFLRVRKKGRSFAHPYFFFVAAENHLPLMRCAITITLRISKKATVRNRLRRQLAAIISGELPRLKRGYDLLILPRPHLVGRSFQEMRSAVQTLLQRMRLL